ncbi:hypothetical protein ERO13_D03G160533v2 [Gossypium hirsutum]|uniref:Uncharacterized protein n=2 Tax=Gossypium TaxID=3633 RepID=A0A5D2LPN9_GOSTO|nr:hypothetical protein ERO13_D03G160533v2 [Gossypium hirsutum]TYG77484.1 hypothetical protein ES288_D03G198700v1 [Gossypium darwinii]TYH81385.1 hypothetical protein ES332_D03G197200v1 [Gossypium tomentosum]
MLSSLRHFNTKRQWPSEPHARLRLRRREHKAGHQAYEAVDVEAWHALRSCVRGEWLGFLLRRLKLVSETV